MARARPALNMSRARARTTRGWARRSDFLNELSDLRRAVVELSDRVAADYVSHALACFAKGKDEAGEVWLGLALEQLAD